MSIFDTLAKAAVKKAAISAAENFGESALETIAKYASDVTIAHMEKNSLSYVFAPQNAAVFNGRDYNDVFAELSAHGFKNINLYEKKDLKNNWLDRSHNQKVVQVSINGKTSFKKQEKFLSDAQVVITYHTFKQE